MIQDSVDDWRYEAMLMGDVYRNSICNTAVTSASNSYEGLFNDRTPLIISPCNITSPWTGQNQTYHLIDLLFWFDNMSRAPLNSRAWVVQERLLAPRVLHYGQSQLLWERHELDACETYPRGVPPVLSSLHSNFEGLDPVIDGSRLRIASGSKADPQFNAHHLWNKIVTLYTISDLTRQGDILIALSGIAKRVEHILGDQYLAGLFKQFLPTQLLWHVDKRKPGNGLPSVKPEMYRAPSWSWAAVDGAISVGGIDDKEILIDIIEV
ncbi:hypothetical protein MMC28_007714 [Mycoblastus sanguinarius]|nr:hypothetical protein [Mycoblastus sanguinarius]